MTTDQINAIGRWLLVFGLLGAAVYFDTHTHPHGDDYAVGCFTAGVLLFIFTI